MTYDLTHDNRVDKRTGYFVRARGLNKAGEEINIVMKTSPHVSGCNPDHWAIQYADHYGEESPTYLAAQERARYAGLSWDVREVISNSIIIEAIEFEVIRKAISL